MGWYGQCLHTPAGARVPSDGLRRSRMPFQREVQPLRDFAPGRAMAAATAGASVGGMELRADFTQRVVR